MKNKDVFDKIMELPILRIFNPIYVKYKSILLYLFFGVMTTIANYVVFYICNTIMKIHEIPSNVIAWVFAVFFAYITNKEYVFDSKENTSKLKEMLQFYSGRVLTLIIETIIIYVFSTKLQYNTMIVKLVASIIVIISNYFISKLFVFK